MEVSEKPVHVRYNELLDDYNTLAKNCNKVVAENDGLKAKSLLDKAENEELKKSIQESIWVSENCGECTGFDKLEKYKIKDDAVD